MLRIKHFWPYLILIFTITGLVYLNGKVVSNQLVQNKEYDRVLNFSGRQRMLSQKLAKNAYQYYVSGIPPEKMSEDLAMWNRVHNALRYGDVAMRIPAPHSDHIKQLMDSLTPVQNRLASLYRLALAARPSDRLLVDINSLEPVFLKGMDNIVFTIESTADSEIGATERTAHKLLFFSGGLVVLELLLIIFPYNRRLLRANKEIQRQKLELLKREEERQELYYRYELTIKGANAGIWYINLQNREVIWSAKFYELLGYSKEELAPSTEAFEELLHPEEKEKLNTAWDEHFKDHKPYKLEVRIKTNSGDYRWFELSGQAEWDIKGVPLLMAGSIIDVEERVVNRKQLEYDGYLLEEAGNMANIGGWYYDVTTETVTWTKAIFGIFETVEENREILKDRVNSYSEEYRPIIQDVMVNAVKRKEPFSIIVEIFTAKGNRKWVKILGRPVENQYGIVVGVRGVYQDIDTEKKREIELEKTHASLQEINDSKDRIFSIIAHDLKSPMASLEMLLSLYNKSKVDPAVMSRQIENMQRTIRNLINTMDNLFNWANSQMNGFKRTPEHFDIKEVIDMVAQLYEESIHQKDIKLQNVAAHFFVFADRGHCQLILRNLINNAVKFTPPGGIISVDTEKSGSMVRINIRDTGMGIPKELLEQIRTGTVKEAGDNKLGEKGSGIGLNLSFEMARENGGMLHVNSVIGKGSTFSLLLPVPMGQIKNAPVFES